VRVLCGGVKFQSGRCSVLDHCIASHLAHMCRHFSACASCPHAQTVHRHMLACKMLAPDLELLVLGTHRTQC
jgi:hypothetical protein